MCEHCGCRGVEPIAELMDEHFELLEISGRIRGLVASGDYAATPALLTELRDRLLPHSRREDRGVFAALRRQAEFVDAVERLEAEHLAFESMLDSLDPAAPDFAPNLERLLAELAEHIQQENLGVFPVAVVTLNASGWDIVNAAHAKHPHERVS